MGAPAHTGMTHTDNKISALEARLNAMEDAVTQGQSTTMLRVDALEAASAEKFQGLQGQVDEVASATKQVGAKVQSLEDLIRGMAAGQQALQTATVKISDSVEGLRDEMLRMSFKRAAEATTEAKASQVAKPSI